MTSLLLAILTLLSGAPEPTSSGPSRGEQRCGWLISPAPGAFTLRDAEGDWLITGSRATGAPAGWSGPPVFEPGQWVDDGQGRGHGCVCMSTVVSVGARMVLRQDGLTAQPLDRCERDARLRSPQEAVR